MYFVEKAGACGVGGARTAYLLKLLMFFDFLMFQ